MQEKPFQINSRGRVQTRPNDLKSAVSEHAKNTRPVQKYRPGKPPAFTQDTQGHINSEAATRN